jgi:4-hydroxy-2-oxoglutarate aldolase
MAHTSHTHLPHGIYTPLPTFFLPCSSDEGLDIPAFRSHLLFTARAGTIPVIAGSAGEAVHLSPHERSLLIRTARQALSEAELEDTIPIVAGVGVPSTRETIRLATEAAEAGADFVLVLPPGYYAGVLQKDGGEALKRYFVDVAAASPLPVILYNFPAVSAGIDLDSDFIVNVVKSAPNIVGAKLTCADVGKITRITAVVHEREFVKNFPRKGREGSRFEVIDGFIDILLPSVAVGAAGAISGLPNFVPVTFSDLLSPFWWATSSAADNGISASA